MLKERRMTIQSNTFIIRTYGVATCINNDLRNINWRNGSRT